MSGQEIVTDEIGKSGLQATEEHDSWPACGSLDKTNSSVEAGMSKAGIRYVPITEAALAPSIIRWELCFLQTKRINVFARHRACWSPLSFERSSSASSLFLHTLQLAADPSTVKTSLSRIRIDLIYSISRRSKIRSMKEQMEELSISVFRNRPRKVPFVRLRRCLRYNDHHHHHLFVTSSSSEEYQRFGAAMKRNRQTNGGGRHRRWWKGEPW